MNTFVHLFDSRPWLDVQIGRERCRNLNAAVCRPRKQKTRPRPGLGICARNVGSGFCLAPLPFGETSCSQEGPPKAVEVVCPSPLLSCCQLHSRWIKPQSHHYLQLFCGPVLLMTRGTLCAPHRRTSLSSSTQARAWVAHLWQWPPSGRIGTCRDLAGLFALVGSL